MLKNNKKRSSQTQYVKMARILAAGSLLLASSLLPCTFALAQGMDLSLTAATSNSKSVKKYGVVAGWVHPRPLWEGQQWRLDLRHELELTGWDVPQAKNIIELGYSPVLRLNRQLQKGVFFVEGSIGARLLSHTRIAPDKTLSTAFQFSDMLGAGWQWDRSTVGMRFQHISNAGIKKPNPGINFLQFYYRYRF